jgi:dihydropteroate synthase
MAPLRSPTHEATGGPTPERPLLMGIVNASPESFSDGGEVGGIWDQVERARRLRDEGAALIDIGGESGVTDRPAVPVAEEIERVVPLIRLLDTEELITTSIDTWKGEVARAAVDAGASIVNDVSGLSDPTVAEVCAETGAGLVITHTRAVPKQKAFPGYRDVGEDVVRFLSDRIELAKRHGVHEDQLILDPGPDLAKTPADTISVLRSLPAVAALGLPVLLAVSRKDFVGALTGRPPAERLAGTLAAIGAGLDGGASILRVHDVAAVKDYLAVRAPLRGERDVPPDLRLDPGLRRAG